MKLPRPLPLAFALATLFGGSAQAQNLVQMYEAARGYDAGYQSAKAQYEASIANAGPHRATFDELPAYWRRTLATQACACLTEALRPAPTTGPLDGQDPLIEEAT